MSRPLAATLPLLLLLACSGGEPASAGLALRDPAGILDEDEPVCDEPRPALEKENG